MKRLTGTFVTRDAHRKPDIVCEYTEFKSALSLHGRRAEIPTFIELRTFDGRLYQRKDKGDYEILDTREYSDSPGSH